MEHAQKEGHQPWRSDAKTVADSGLLQVEAGLDPREIGSIPFTRASSTAMVEIYRYHLSSHGQSARVTVRRFHWSDPMTGRKYRASVWWVTEVVIEDCGKHGRK